MFKKILVPLDGSDLAERALDVSIDMASCYGGEIILMEVQEEGMDVGEAAVARATALATGSAAQAMEVFRHHAEAYLREVVEKRRAQTDVPIQIVVAQGNPAESIVAQAQEMGVDLIVMSTHGRTGLRRFAFGSVTEDVLHHATCPVLVIRPAVANPN